MVAVSGGNNELPGVLGGGDELSVGKDLKKG